MLTYDEFLVHIQASGNMEIKYEPLDGESARREGMVTLSDDARPFIGALMHRLADTGLLENELAVLGKGLYGALFPGEVSSLFERAVHDVGKDENRRLRVLIGMEADSEVVSWPVEFMRGPMGWLSTDKRLTLSRRIYFKGLEYQDESPVSPPLKVLVVVSRPQGLGGVMTAKVIEAIGNWDQEDQQPALPAPPSTSAGPSVRLTASPNSPAASTHRTEVRLIGSLEDFEKDTPGVTDLGRIATFQNLREVAQQWRPHVLHFIGHGKFEGHQGHLAMMKADGQVDWINASEFGEALATFTPRLVMLQACESAGAETGTSFLSLAGILMQHAVSKVVAMQFEIRNDFATLFSTEFYKYLAQGFDVDTAVQEGRWQIPNDSNIRWRERHFGTPVLFVLNPKGIIAAVQPAARLPETTPVPAAPPPSLSVGRGDSEDIVSRLFAEAAKRSSLGQDDVAAQLGKVALDILAKDKQNPTTAG